MGDDVRHPRTSRHASIHATACPPVGFDAPQQKVKLLIILFDNRVPVGLPDSLLTQFS